MAFDDQPSIIDTSQALPDPRLEISPEQQFLQLYLEAETLTLLSIKHLVEIMTIPMGQVVPIFQMPPWVMGVYNWRGDVLWMVDLNHLVGFSPWYQQQGHTSKHTTVVIRSQSKTNSSTKEIVLGLVVNRIEDIVLCEPDQIQDPSDFVVVRNLVPFLKGVWPDPGGETYLVIDGETILRTVATSSQSRETA